MSNDFTQVSLLDQVRTLAAAANLTTVEWVQRFKAEVNAACMTAADHEANTLAIELFGAFYDPRTHGPHLAETLAK